MMKMLPFAAILAVALPVRAAQLDASESLFTVMAAVNMAGYDDGLESPNGHPLRKAIREEIGKRKTPELEKLIEQLREFRAEHRQENAAWELRQWVSLGLLIEGAPEFKFRLKAHQLPPDVGALESVLPLLSKFYKDAGVADLWQRSQPAVEQMLARYQEPAIRATQEVSAYLRAPLGEIHMGRRFQLVVELLAAPNSVQSANFLDDYYLVMTPSPEVRYEDIRSAYLFYLLDPVATQNIEKVEKKKALGDYALGSPLLAEHYKQDFVLLTTRSLIKAVEARLAPVSRRAAMVEEAMKEGFILTAYFAEQLPAYEKQEQAMRLYFPEMIDAIDFRKEEARLDKLEFAEQRQTRTVKVQVKEPEPSEVEKAIRAAEDLYLLRELDKARDAYARIAQMTADRQAQATAYYGMARIATLRNDRDLALRLFEKAYELGPPPPEKAWTLVYLGRLSMAMGEYEQAGQRFRAAMELSGASDKAREAAQAAMKQLESRQR